MDDFQQDPIFLAAAAGAILLLLMAGMLILRRRRESDDGQHSYQWEEEADGTEWQATQWVDETMTFEEQGTMDWTWVEESAWDAQQW